MPDKLLLLTPPRVLDSPTSSTRVANHHATTSHQETQLPNSITPCPAAA